MALPKSKLWRVIIVFGGFAILVAIFYTEEDWRGKHDWEKCKAEMEAKEVVLDWNKYIPAPVPDDQNFFKAPKMQEWFTGRGEKELGKRLYSTNENLTTSFGEKSLIKTPEAAQKYISWSDQFEPDFNLIREALKRPYARMDGDYSFPAAMPIPNFLTVRSVAQVLAQRAHCYILLNQPDKALQELTFMHDICRLLEGAPSGKPMTLVAAMINVAVSELYADTIAEGFRFHVWQEPQLVLLQKQLAEINLTPFVLEALQEEPIAMCKDIMISPYFKFMGYGRTTFFGRIEFWLWPRGWTYQNMVNIAVLELTPLDGFDLANDTIAPGKFDGAAREMDKFLRHKSPYKLLAAAVVPNFMKAWQTTAHNQTMVNEAQIACALERYKIAHGDYPETLDALAPQFIEKIPHDIIGGGSLIYHTTSGGNYLLYSIGWNGKDDGGLDVSQKNSGIVSTNGDWVWKN